MNLLEEIVAHKRMEVTAAIRNRPLRALPQRDYPIVSLHEALSRDGIQIIAEVKRKSPSAGDLAHIPEPTELAHAYRRGGAAAISVLTDRHYFGGSLGDLESLRSEVRLPLLRKDFIIDPYQVHESLSAGADAVLLIADILTMDELEQLYGLTTDLGMQALVESYGAEALRKVNRLAPAIAGLNARDLTTMEISVDKLINGRRDLPSGAIHVAESGITSVDDFQKVAAAGYHATLIGSALVTSTSPQQAVANFLAGQKVES